MKNDAAPKNAAPFFLSKTAAPVFLFDTDTVKDKPDPAPASSLLLKGNPF